MTRDNMMSMNFDCLGWDKSPESAGERQEWTCSKHLHLLKLYEEKSNVVKTDKEALVKTKEVKFVHA